MSEAVVNKVSQIVTLLEAEGVRIEKTLTGHTRISPDDATGLRATYLAITEKILPALAEVLLEIEEERMGLVPAA